MKQGTIFIRSVTIQLFSAGSKTSHWISVLVGVGLIGCSPSIARIEQVTAQPDPVQTASPQTGTGAFSQLNQRSAIADAEALVAIGPRVTGTPAAEQASRYVEAAFQEAGYVTRIQTFTYSRFVDRGSSLTVNGTTLEGRALSGSMQGNRTARLVAVPNVGRPEDFDRVDVRGAIAIVRRGEIRFVEKVNNAVSAGAVGLVIVNTGDDNFQGTLGSNVTIPVLALGGKAGQSLLSTATASATLNVNAIQETVTGRNVVAHLEGVTQPQLLLGAHYDSVAGSPGANDNASGTAVLLDMARRLSETPIGRQAWFVAFDGEEDGLHGSRAFVRNAGSPFLRQLRAMLNFDMVGVNSRLEVSGADSLTRLVKSGGGAIALGSASGGSDHVPFDNAGVPILFFNRGIEPNYHTPNDRQVNSQLLNETAQVAMGILERLFTPNSF